MACLTAGSEKELIQTRIPLPVALQTFANHCLDSLQMFPPDIVCGGLWLLCGPVCSQDLLEEDTLQETWFN